MSRYSNQSYFFSQKKRSFVRRFRKPLDTLSILGEKREPILSFRPQAAREGGEGEEKGTKSSHHKRPPSAVSRASSARIRLPPVDPSGPHLTTVTPQLPPELSERKQVILQSFEQPLTAEEVLHPNQIRYKFNEIKIASTGILFNLTQRLETVSSEINLPESLSRTFLSHFHQLIADTIVDKREWQTDCYLDYKPRSAKLFLTETPAEGDKSRQDLASSLSRVVRRERKGKGSVKMNLERPMTAKSTASGISIRSDASHGSSHDADYDKLPPELRTQGPQILRYRRESQAPRRKLSGPKTRLEKFQAMRQQADRRYQGKEASKGTRKLSLFTKTHVHDDSKDEKDFEEVVNTRPSLLAFSLSSKVCADQGWIVHPSQSQDPEGYTLNNWASGQLKEAMRQREEAKLTAKLRGEDGPLIVKYYSDSHTRSLRGGRHQRSSSLPLPSILNKLPPSLANFSSPETHDTLVAGENLCLLQLPDKTGFCNYYSGRCAVSMSRKGDGSRGLYTIAFDDTDSNNVLAYFMPTGQTACYHRNGALHMLTNTKGGKLLDEDGFVIREWEWPSLNQRMNQAVLIQLNTHLAVQCTSRTQMVLKFSCHGQMYRFPVGLTPESLAEDTKNQSFWMKKTDVISDTLQTNLGFQSQTAKSFIFPESDTESPFTSKPQSRDAASDSRRRSFDGKGGGEKSEAQLAESQSVSDWSKMACYDKDLETYKNKIMTIVSDWLSHYRHSIGITTPAHLSGCGLNNSVSLLASLSFRSHQWSRPQTRPSSRPSSRLLSHSPSPSHSPVADVRAASPGVVHSISPLNDFIERPKSHDQPRPFKAGPAKPRPHPPYRNRLGCPVALHEMLVKKLSEMPQCKCDKRRLSLIRDVEFEIFMTSHVATHQLVVICITHSMAPLVCEPLLEDVNYSCNRNRSSPCQQSIGDHFRIFKYDLECSLDDLTSGQPLLVGRHRVSPGMFLFYMGNQLIGGYTGFNGYGTTRRDFMKQVRRSTEAGKRKEFLPADFKFSDSSLGSKVHSSSLWAYPVSGVHDEFVSVTPSSVNSSADCVLTALDSSFGFPKDSKLIFKKKHS